MTRAITNKLIELVDEGMLTWEQIARAALSYMSEDEVADVAYTNELISEEDDLDELLEDEDDIDALLADDEEDEADATEFAARWAEADAVDAALAQLLSRSTK